MFARTAFIVLAILILNGASASGARTPRYYPDKDAVSSNGFWRVSARSLDNMQGGDRIAFQRNFIFTLHDVQRGKIVWQIDQDDTGSPVRLHVDDEGRVVYWASGEECFLVTLDGQRTRLFALRDAILPGDWPRFVSDTTAGPMWMQLSHWYFATTEQGPLFVVRAWWGRRFVCDLSNHVLIDEPDPKVLRLLDEAEGAWALKKLTIAAAEPAGKDHDPDLYTAAHLAGVMGIEESIPALRQIESRWRTTVSGGRFSGTGEPNYQIDQLRQLVQLSLRRLGQQPAGYPPIILMKPGGWDHGLPARTDQPAPAADGMTGTEATARVRIGMSYQEVVALLGGPDSNAVPLDPASEWGLDFDVDAEKPGERPFTFRAEFRDAQLVRTNRIEPPAWQGSLQRDRQFGF